MSVYFFLRRLTGIFVVPVLFAGSLQVACSQPVSNLSVPPDGPKQMAVLYTHGFNDDGAAWGLGDLSGEAGSIPNLTEFRARYQTNLDSAVRLFNSHGIETYAVQWTAASPDVFSDPYASSAEGFAFLADLDQLRTETDWLGGTRALHDRARPSFMDVLKTGDMDILLPTYAPAEVALETAWWPIGVPEFVRQAGRKTFYLALTANINNYNDSGRAADHAEDLLDLLRNERETGGRLADYRQVNILTHSKGSLVTRAFLHMANEASREDAEYVANVTYNAPPFAGSSLTEILKLFYDPIVVTRAHLANPWLAQTMDEVRDGLIGTGDVDVRLGDVVRALWQRLCDPFGYDFADIEAQLPLVTNNLDLMNVFEAESVLLFDMANAPDGTLPADLGNLVAVVANLVRPLIAAGIGIPSFPTAREDLTPQGGMDFIQDFQNTSNAFQVVNIGTSSPMGVQHMLWPGAGLAAVAADPSLLIDPAVQQGQVSDTYVAAPSAELLTATDAFGPRMTLGGFYPTDHGGITLDLGLMASNWMAVYLAPSTTLRLAGAITVVSDAERIYSVSTDTTIAFNSANFLREVEGTSVRIEAQYHQYRFVPVYSAAAEPTPWERMDLGTSRPVGDALQAHGLIDMPVRLQWRAINLAGGREMIRAATLLPVGDPPVVTRTDMLGLSSEIARIDDRRIGAGRAIRTDFLKSLGARVGDYIQIVNSPEADWIVRNASTKALVAVFDKSGSVDYAWDDSSLVSAVTLENVNALFLELDGLSDGIRTLTFQPFTEVGGQERRGPVQTLRVYVDNTAPEHSLTGLEPGALAFRFGPATTLQYRAEDMESGGATGNVTVFGYTNILFDSGTTFRLGETDLAEQIRGVPGSENAPGAYVTLRGQAQDRVANSATVNIEAYYDFTPPDLINLEVSEGLPSGVRVVVFTNRVELSIDVRDLAGSEIMPPCAVFQNLDTGAASCSAPFSSVGVFSGYRRYRGEVELVEGDNLIQIVCQDVLGNVGSTMVLVDSRQLPPTDTTGLVVMTPRIDNVNSLYYSPAGDSTNFNDNAIAEVAVSYDGSRFLFSSLGNGFVYGDSNSREDVFLSDAGRVTRVSTGSGGEQALGGHSDRPVLSGDGRYAFFQSQATNLVAGTANVNLYAKDLETGEIAVISRHFNGDPINRFVGTFVAAATYTGRYVYFETRNADYVDGVDDVNTGRDIYVVDLDPDRNGYFFDDNYVTRVVSTALPNKTGNGDSFAPSISRDGRYLVYRTTATDITPDLAINGNTVDALLVKFSGNGETGNLNFGIREYYVVNRSSVAGGNPTPNGVSDVVVASDGDTVLFATRSDVQFSGDTGGSIDVYASIGETFGTASISNRISSWQSRGLSGAPSSSPATIRRMTVAQDQRPSEFHNNKIAWVSSHTNLVQGDVNRLHDLFVGTAGGLGVTPGDPTLPNWITDELPSNNAMTDGGLTPDGRYAWWVTSQTYTAPYADGRSHIYRRRLDPPLTYNLTIAANGRGEILRSPEGQTLSAGIYGYGDQDDGPLEVVLEAVPQPFNRHTGWVGLEPGEEQGAVARVRMHSDRTVAASFGPARIPVVSSFAVVMDEDSVSDPVWPLIVDPDEGDVHTLSVVTEPANGTVEITPAGFVYTPDPNFDGTENFTFQVTDRYGLMAQTPVSATFKMVPINDVPVVEGKIVAVIGQEPRGPMMPPFTDADEGDVHQFEIELQALHGRAWVADGGLYYAPNRGYEGPDSFTYRVIDQAGAVAVGLVQVEVVPVPRIRNIGIVTDLFLRTLVSVEVDSLPTGVRYTAEFIDDLSRTTWRVVQPSSQWPSQRTRFSENLVVPERYYRLRFEYDDD